MIESKFFQLDGDMLRGFQLPGLKITDPDTSSLEEELR